MQNNENRSITFIEAIREATDLALGMIPECYVIGEGVPDPKFIFNSTLGLREKHGPNKVLDMPISENGVTGVVIGSAITGMRPIIVHQRIDFTMYAMDQMVNNAAKWFSMFGGQKSVPMVMRAIIGRGWGQGNQHSQNLSGLYAHIPGLKVVMPSTAYTAKGLFLAAVRDNNPVVFIEHRWLHNTSSNVPQEYYELPIGKCRVVTEGTDITIVTWSYMCIETLKAAQFLVEQGISVEIIDVMTLRPLDIETIKNSVRKTGRLLVVEEAWKFGGLAGEIIAGVSEDSSVEMRSRPQRLTNPDYPSPSTHGLIRGYYTTVAKIFSKVAEMVGANLNSEPAMAYDQARIPDVPDQNFKGPF